MKKLLSLTLAVTMLLGTLAGCGSNTDNGQGSGQSSGQDNKERALYQIAIVQPMSHPSLDQIRDSIIKNLGDGNQDINITTYNANSDTTALSSILSNCKANGVDLVIPIATATAQTAKTVFDGTDTPIVFAAVSDPVLAGLTGEDSKNITGVYDQIPTEEIISLIHNFQPDCKKIGLLYTSSETSSISIVNALKKYCDEKQLAYEEASIANLSELQTAVETLIAKGVDALYTGNDNTIASAMATYTDAANAGGVPIYCGADSMVAEGGFATIGVNYVTLGAQVAEMASLIMQGSKPEDLPMQRLDEFGKFVNMQAAERLGEPFPETSYEGYEVLVERDGTSHFGE